MRFTDKGIVALKPKAERYEVWEDGKTGLGVRVSTRGRKSWIFMYRFNGRARRMTLGTYPPLTLANARVLQAKAKESKEKGEDPGVAHIAERRAERQAHTIADLVNEYLEKHARPNKRSAAADERTLQKEITPVWGRRKAKDITRRDIIRLLDDVVDRGSPVMANRLLALLRRMFGFAVERDILGATPCVYIKAPAKETPRDRVLSSTEIAIVWQVKSEFLQLRLPVGTFASLSEAIIVVALLSDKKEVVSARFCIEPWIIDPRISPSMPLPKLIDVINVSVNPEPISSVLHTT